MSAHCHSTGSLSSSSHRRPLGASSDQKRGATGARGQGREPVSGCQMCAEYYRLLLRPHEVFKHNFYILKTLGNSKQFASSKRLTRRFDVTLAASATREQTRASRARLMFNVSIRKTQIHRTEEATGAVTGIKLHSISPAKFCCLFSFASNLLQDQKRARRAVLLGESGAGIGKEAGSNGKQSGGYMHDFSSVIEPGKD